MRKALLFSGTSDGSRLAHFEHLHHRNIIGGRYLRIPASMIGSTYYRFKDAR